MKKHFYGNMDWFNTVEEPDGISALPPEFAQAKKLWEEDGKGNFAAIDALVGHYVKGLFLHGEISGGEELFSGSEGEVEASVVHVAGFDFGGRNIPLIKAEAWFTLEVVEGFDEVNLEEWQENNDFFHSAVSFYWEIDPDELDLELDFTWEDHQGREAYPVDEEEFSRAVTTHGKENAL